MTGCVVLQKFSPLCDVIYRTKSIGYLWAILQSLNCKWHSMLITQEIRTSPRHDLVASVVRTQNDYLLQLTGPRPPALPHCYFLYHYFSPESYDRQCFRPEHSRVTRSLTVRARHPLHTLSSHTKTHKHISPAWTPKGPHNPPSKPATTNPPTPPPKPPLRNPNLTTYPPPPAHQLITVNPTMSPRVTPATQPRLPSAEATQAPSKRKTPPPLTARTTQNPSSKASRCAPQARETLRQR